MATGSSLKKNAPDKTTCRICEDIIVDAKGKKKVKMQSSAMMHANHGFTEAVLVYHERLFCLKLAVNLRIPSIVLYVD